MIPPQIKIGIAIAVAAAVAVMGWRLHAAVTANGELRASVKHYQQQLATAAMEANEAASQAAKDIAARDAATAEARRQAAQNAARAATLAAQLEEARNDHAMSACLDMRLPDTVRLP